MWHVEQRFVSSLKLWLQVHVKSILTDGSNNHEKEEWDCPGEAVLKALSDTDPMPLGVESLLEDVWHTLGGLVMDSLDCCLPLFKGLGSSFETA